MWLKLQNLNKLNYIKTIQNNFEVLNIIPIISYNRLEISVLQYLPSKIYK